MKRALARSSSIETVTTTELETAAFLYGRGVFNPRLTAFEVSAVLKGIAAELAQRDAEWRALRH